MRYVSFTIHYYNISTFLQEYLQTLTRKVIKKDLKLITCWPHYGNLKDLKLITCWPRYQSVTCCYILLRGTGTGGWLSPDMCKGPADWLLLVATYPVSSDIPDLFTANSISSGVKPGN